MISGDEWKYRNGLAGLLIRPDYPFGAGAAILLTPPAEGLAQVVRRNGPASAQLGTILLPALPRGWPGRDGTDFDALDDNWIPRIYELKFSFSTWLTNLPPFLLEEPAWDWEFHPDYYPHNDKAGSDGAQKLVPDEII